MGFSFKKKADAEALRDAAPLLFGNEWADLDMLGLQNDDRLGVGDNQNKLVRCVVTEEITPASVSGTEPDVTVDMGAGYAQPLMIIPSPNTGRDDVYDESQGGMTMIPDIMPMDHNDATIPIWNPFEQTYAVDEIITVLKGETCFFVVSEKTEPEPGAKRVKFKLTEPLCKSGSLQSGFADALVIDPMNSGLAVDSQITVWDYKKQFTTSQASAIGIATKNDPYGEGQQWHIEECEQLVNEIEGELDGSIGPWMVTNPDITSISASSTWPYLQWYGEESEGGDVSGAKNTRRFTAGNGPDGNPQVATAKRVIPDAYLPDPDNQTAPYTLEPLTPEWDITSVKYPTARWSQTLYSNSTGTFNLDTSQYAEGYSPDLHSDIANGDPADPPPGIKNEFDPFVCNVPDNTAGWAFLDDSTGDYVTIATASSLFGAPTKISAVAKIEGTESDKLIDNEGNCGVIEHELLLNALVWGDVNGNGTGCRLENITPKPEVDVLADASDIEVVTGVIINGDGNLEMQKSTIKACDSPATNDILTANSMDVVNDVYCSGDSLTKDYKTIKFFGSVENSQSGVAIDTSCIDIDYYQITYPTYPYIDYYDIIWPDGCDPCPSADEGCCTITYNDGKPQADFEGVSEGWCDTEALRSDVASTSWSSGPCSGGGGACEGGTISNFQMSGLDNSGGGCNASFTQVGTATMSGGSATINVTWTGFNGTGQSQAGTISLSSDGTDWTWNGDIPWEPSVNVVGSDAGAGCGSASGGATSPGGAAFPCNGTWSNGTWSFTFTP